MRAQRRELKNPGFIRLLYMGDRDVADSTGKSQ